MIVRGVNGGTQNCIKVITRWWTVILSTLRTTAGSYGDEEWLK